MKLEDLKKIRDKHRQDMILRNGDARIRLVVGMGTSGIAAGARETLHVLLEEIEKRNLNDIIVTQAGERGLSSHEPVVTIFEKSKPHIVYGKVTADVARRIMAEHIVNGRPVSEYVLEVGA